MTQLALVVRLYAKVKLQCLVLELPRLLQFVKHGGVLGAACVHCGRDEMAS